MTYNVLVTSQGTTTIPAEFRKKYGIKKGSKLSVHDNPKTGEIILTAYPSLGEIHELNKKIMKQKNISFTKYKTGDGFKSYVKQRYES